MEEIKVAPKVVETLRALQKQVEILELRRDTFLMGARQQADAPHDWNLDLDKGAFVPPEGAECRSQTSA